MDAATDNVAPLLPYHARMRRLAAARGWPKADAYAFALAVRWAGWRVTALDGERALAVDAAGARWAWRRGRGPGRDAAGR